MKIINASIDFITVNGQTTAQYRLCHRRTVPTNANT